MVKMSHKEGSGLQAIEKAGLTKELLEDLYLNQKLSTTVLAKQFNISPASIGRALKAFGIESRKQPKNKITASKEELEKLYYLDGLTMTRPRCTPRGAGSWR